MKLVYVPIGLPVCLKRLSKLNSNIYFVDISESKYIFHSISAPTSLIISTLGVLLNLPFPCNFDINSMKGIYMVSKARVLHLRKQEVNRTSILAPLVVYLLCIKALMSMFFIVVVFVTLFTE